MLLNLHRFAKNLCHVREPGDIFAEPIRTPLGAADVTAARMALSSLESLTLFAVIPANATRSEVPTF